MKKKKLFDVNRANKGYKNCSYINKHFMITTVYACSLAFLNSIDFQK